MSAWGSTNAWATQVEEEEEEEANQEAEAAAEEPAPTPVPFRAGGATHQEAAFPTLGDIAFPGLGQPIKKKDDDFPSLGMAVSNAKQGKKAKKEKAKTMSLTAFQSERAGGDDYQLPTGPRERTEEEENQPRGGTSLLGGAFKDYGGRDGSRGGRDGGPGDRNREERRGGFGDRDRGDREERGDAGPSRSDENNWFAAKKFVPSESGPRRAAGFDGDRDDRRGGDREDNRGPSRADEDSNWGAGKKFVPSEPRGGDRDRGFGGDRDRGFGGDRDRDRGGYGGRGGLDDRGGDRDWRREDRREEGPPAERPRLSLQKRTLPVEEPAAPSSSDSEPKANPFGGAAPVETREVRKEDGPAEPREREWRKEEPRKEPERSWRRDEPPSRSENRPEERGAEPARPKLNLKPRTVAETSASAAGGSSLFGGARPRELALEEKGRDWRKEDIALSRKAVNRPQSEKEKSLEKELEALRAADKDAVDAASGKANHELISTKEAELEKLTLELDDKVRFAVKSERGPDKVDRRDDPPREERRPREPKPKPEKDADGFEAPKAAAKKSATSNGEVEKLEVAVSKYEGLGEE
ncbi:hypothetical protein CYMTET_56736 [Cymbomonas tetramitiformis]|uniref:Uncharacterized protein n=1 Tax=Cymbomonas tetramitiformis TaxID=36881 RepID=A0AAE0EM98_9CHLO|nr:hypothetical protein CYMTET_56736 [Cymbomonas tetramitiformis]